MARKHAYSGIHRVAWIALAGPVLFFTLWLSITHRQGTPNAEQEHIQNQDVSEEGLVADAPSAQFARESDADERLESSEAAVPTASASAAASAPVGKSHESGGQSRPEVFMPKQESIDAKMPFDDDAILWDGFCDQEIPSYDLEDWGAKNGKVLPSTPAIFRGHPSEEGLKRFGTKKKFVDAFGDAQFPHPPNPEYGVPGGYGAHVRSSRVRRQMGKMTVRELVEQWDERHLYFSQFSCKNGNLCKQVWPSLGIPQLFQGPVDSENFLLGGRGSGLPLHSHGKTWQGLVSGRKVWFFLPPNRVSEELHDLTGPYLFPVRGWARMVRNLPLGKRPLICVQRPGEIFYFPDNWLHGTLNLDEFQLAWGAKPQNRQEATGSAEQMTIFTYYPEPPSFSRFSYPYLLHGRLDAFPGKCSQNADEAIDYIDEPMQRMNKFAYQARELVHNSALLDNAVFAFCTMAEDLWKRAQHSSCPKDHVKRLLSRWRSQAEQASPTIFQDECLPFPGTDLSEVPKHP